MAAKKAEYDPSQPRDIGAVGSVTGSATELAKAMAKLDSIEATGVRVQTAGMSVVNAVRAIRKSLFPKVIILAMIMAATGSGCTTVVKDDMAIQARLGNLEGRVTALEKR